MNPILIFILKALAVLLVTSTTVGFIKLLVWFREVKTNHLPHIQTAAEEARDGVHMITGAIEKQTIAIVAELREQRADIRALTQKL